MINQNKIFITVYPKKISLFSKAKGEFVFPELKQENKLIGNKRRRDSRCIISFEKIQQDVVYDLVKKTKKIISYVLGTNCFEKGFIIFKFLFNYLILFYYLYFIIHI